MARTPQLAELPQIVSDIESGDITRQLNATSTLRKLLSIGAPMLAHCAPCAHPPAAHTQSTSRRLTASLRRVWCRAWFSS